MCKLYRICSITFHFDILVCLFVSGLVFLSDCAGSPSTSIPNGAGSHDEAGDGDTTAPLPPNTEVDTDPSDAPSLTGSWGIFLTQPSECVFSDQCQYWVDNVLAYPYFPIYRCPSDETYTFVHLSYVVCDSNGVLFNPDYSPNPYFATMSTTGSVKAQGRLDLLDNAVELNFSVTTAPDSPLADILEFHLKGLVVEQDPLDIYAIDFSELPYGPASGAYVTGDIDLRSRAALAGKLVTGGDEIISVESWIICEITVRSKFLALVTNDFPENIGCNIIQGANSCSEPLLATCEDAAALANAVVDRFNNFNQDAENRFAAAEAMAFELCEGASVSHADWCACEQRPHVAESCDSLYDEDYGTALSAFRDADSALAALYIELWVQTDRYYEFSISRLVESEQISHVDTYRQCCPAFKLAEAREANAHATAGLLQTSMSGRLSHLNNLSAPFYWLEQCGWKCTPP